MAVQTLCKKHGRAMSLPDRCDFFALRTGKREAVDPVFFQGVDGSRSSAAVVERPGEQSVRLPPTGRESILAFQQIARLAADPAPVECKRIAVAPGGHLHPITAGDDRRGRFGCRRCCDFTRRCDRRDIDTAAGRISCGLIGQFEIGKRRCHGCRRVLDERARCGCGRTARNGQWCGSKRRLHCRLPTAYRGQFTGRRRLRPRQNRRSLRLYDFGRLCRSRWRNRFRSYIFKRGHRPLGTFRSAACACTGQWIEIPGVQTCA